MRTMNTICALATAALLGASTLASAQQAGDEVTVPLSDPGRPALIKIDVVQGGVTIKGMNRRDVLIVARSEDRNRRQRDQAQQGSLRRLTMPGGMEVTEERNEVNIETSPTRHTLLEIQVPLRTNLKIDVVNGGSLIVEDVEGEMELDNVNGAIHLRRVAGSVVANTVNGSLQAVLNRLEGQRPMSFTSLNGSVDVTLPSSLKANLKLRSDNGDVFTDFDMQIRQESSTTQSRRGNGRLRIEVNKSIYGVVNGGGPEIELRSFNGSVFVRKGQ